PSSFFRLSLFSFYSLFFFFLTLPHPPISTLFPYTTLFRSYLHGWRHRPAPFERAAGIAVHADVYKKRPLQRPDGTHARSRHHDRLEEHTSELQSRGHLVCRLLLEKKKK